MKTCPQFVTALALLFTLSACTTMHAGSTDGAGLGDPDVRQLVGRSVAALRQLTVDLAAPATVGQTGIDTAIPVRVIEDARISIITAGAVQLDRPGLAAKAELATLTLLLTLCRERVRAADGVVAGSSVAHDSARLLGQRCIAPLSLMLG